MMKTQSIKPIIQSLFQLFLLSIAGCASFEQTHVDTTPPVIAATVEEQADQKITEEVQATHDTKSTVAVQTGRYTTIQAVPTLEQRHLLQVLITVTIPEDIKTIGETVNYLTRRSGYKLQPLEQHTSEVQQLLAKPLPDVHRHLGPMTLHDALSVLATPVFILQEDPVHRLLSYQLDQQYTGDSHE